ncbi:MAG TPA: nuclear transport factor 2 family protein [Gaiellaceae bacterium]|nr:nuclear transport factor 2 family protein [Gaiellaceae bacterium]
MAPSETFDALFASILEHRDVDAFMALWAGDDDVTMWGSDLHERAVGRDAIRKLGTQIAAATHVIECEWDDKRVHGEGETAWINASGALVVDGKRVNYRITAIFVRQGERWLWHTFNGSIPD